MRNFFILLLTVFGLGLFLMPPRAIAADEFGIVGAVPSLNDGAKQQAVELMSELGVGWNRHEFFYADSMDFGPYDSAQAKLESKGIKTLGLLAYPGHDKTHDDWKRYVQTVVSHYGARIAAWEIMNEADNYLSGADYAQYAREARDIIKSINPNATIVLAGITSRPETPNFWNAIAAAGGWDIFDVVGLHVYHSGYPESVNFGGGDLLAEYDRAVAAINRLGSKKIWITETGYKVSETGADNQADWLARTLIISRSVSSVQRIFIYRLYDDSRETYGLTGADFSRRPAYDVVKSTIASLTGRGVGARQYPQQQTVIDNLESTSGWKTDASSNGSLGLSTVSGKNGQAMQLQYSFSADQAYVVAQKPIAIAGTPQALGVWINGDNTKNVWKFRFKDTKGEMFQADLGTTTSGWTYKQFTLGQDKAIVSWDGDGKIDYPISFNAIVVDRQGSGDASGTGAIDELTAITGEADLYSFLFGDRLVYWKVSGSSSLAFCGATRHFTARPQFADGVSCDSMVAKPVTATATGEPAATTKPSPTPARVVDSKQSMVRVDGSNILADGQQTYRIVLLLKDAQGVLIKNQVPKVTIDGNLETVKLTNPVLVGDEWWMYVSASEAGNRNAAITVGSVVLPSQILTFVPVPLPSPSVSPVVSPSPSPSPLPTVSPKAMVKASRTRVIWGGLALVTVISLTGLALWRYRRAKKLKIKV